jgi:hypothetical protein
MNLADVKFVIEDDCRGAVSGIKIKDSRSVYSRSPVYSTDESYPISGGDATTFRVVFPNVSNPMLCQPLCACHLALIGCSFPCPACTPARTCQHLLTCPHLPLIPAGLHHHQRHWPGVHRLILQQLQDQPSMQEPAHLLQ